VATRSLHDSFPAGAAVDVIGALRGVALRSGVPGSDLQPFAIKLGSGGDHSSAMASQAGAARPWRPSLSRPSKMGA